MSIGGKDVNVHSEPEVTCDGEGFLGSLKEDRDVLRENERGIEYIW